MRNGVKGRMSSYNDADERVIEERMFGALGIT